MTIELEQYELPAHWACAFLYGDLDGLPATDLQAIMAFTNDMMSEHGQCLCVSVDSDESGNFMRCHDAHSYGIGACDAATFTFRVTKR